LLAKDASWQGIITSMGEIFLIPKVTRSGSKWLAFYVPAALTIKGSQAPVGINITDRSVIRTASNPSETKLMSRPVCPMGFTLNILHMANQAG
jgi:hypothetical protein